METFDQVCDKVIEKQGGDRTLFLSFSRGKDSISSFLRCYESGKFNKYFLFHYYQVPEMSFVDDYIDYFKNRFKDIDLELIQVPAPIFYKMLDSGLLQRPTFIKSAENLYLQNRWRTFFSYSFDELSHAVRDCYLLPDDTYTAVGVKMSDSMMRRTAILKYGVVNENNHKWFPAWDYTPNDIRAIIKKHNVRLPDDYELFNMTFDGLDYRFLKVLQTKRPKDYAKIKEYFPLLDLLIIRREHYLGTDIKRSKISYSNSDIFGDDT